MSPHPALAGLFDLPEEDLRQVLRQAREDLEELRGGRFFLTGGTGFFGKWLVASLAYAEAQLDLGLSLTILSRRPERFLEDHPAVGRIPLFRLVRGDVGEFEPGGEAYDFILHAATDTTAITSAREEEERSRAVIQGTAAMIALLQRSGARRLLHISSGAVYGTRAGQPTGAREEDFEGAAPVTPYAVAKRRAEELCFDSDIDFVTARAFAFLGPLLPLEAHYAAGNFLRDARRGGPILVRGDGTALRSYLHPVDLMTWLLRLLVRGRKGAAYNVGSDEVVSTAELARGVAAASPGSVEVVIQAEQPQGPQNIYLPDVTRARTELGLEIGVPLEEAIRRTLGFLGRQRG